MVNQSKVKDQRFWNKWRESGAVGNMVDAFLRGYESKDLLPKSSGNVSSDYARHLTFVRRGNIFHEPTAREFATENGLDLAYLKSAVEEGASPVRNTDIRYLNNGVGMSDENFQRLKSSIEFHGVSATPLEEAYRGSMKRQFETHTRFINEGVGDLSEQIRYAKHFAVRAQCDEGPLESAIQSRS
ncbi:MAG: hypothetical protein ABIG93_04435 [archaeon]|nr:hypothetical protein [Nanoarchaeota archaeon]